MKIIIIMLLIVIYAYICVKGYEDGRRVGYRHSKEQIEAIETDLIHATDSLSEYARKRLRENLFNPIKKAE
ncbi:hypothetical protein LCGC14_1829940 [marine sediment metagenome]|uniref:Uncharacterized protein n=1 Tax=marine sediment metagenome TaxID=412755 RepID=A0A0F9GGN5_9ZZZZ